MTPPGAPIYFGVAGWSYPDWTGYVYEKGLRDPLRYLSGFVDMIEINSTFYRPPNPATAASWLRRVADRPEFFFSAKLHQDITHRGLLEPSMIQAFRQGLEPLRAGGRLRHLLAQFRYDFADHPAAREQLRRIHGELAGMAVLVVEVRHVSWQAPDALHFLEALPVTVANLDYPLAANSFNLSPCWVGEHGYFRLHGRNTTAWFDKQAGRDATYDYLYSAPELESLRERAAAVAARQKTLTIVANNHWHAKAVANILQLKNLFTGRRLPVPAALRRHYPELAAIAGNDPTGEEQDLFGPSAIPGGAAP